jgi:hypothetical protein
MKKCCSKSPDHGLKHKSPSDRGRIPIVTHKQHNYAAKTAKSLAEGIYISVNVEVLFLFIIASSATQNIFGLRRQLVAEFSILPSLPHWYAVGEI